MKLNKKHIPFFAAAVQTAQYALAGYFLIGHLGWFFLGSMGALVSLAVAYGTSQFSDIADKRKRGSLVALVLLMALSPIVIGTATWIHLTVISNVYWRGVVSAAWGSLPDMAVALSGFIAGKGLVEQGDRPKQVAGNKPKSKKKLAQDTPKPAPKVARNRVKDTDLLAYLQANAGASQQQVADHFKVTRQAIGPRVKKLYEVKQ